VLDEKGHQPIDGCRCGPASRSRELDRAIGIELPNKSAAEIIARARRGEA